MGCLVCVFGGIWLFGVGGFAWGMGMGIAVGLIWIGCVYLRRRFIVDRWREKCVCLDGVSGECTVALTRASP